MSEDEDLSANGAIGGDFFGDLAPYVDDALDTSDHHYHQRPPRHHHHQMTAGAGWGRAAPPGGMFLEGILLHTTPATAIINTTHHLNHNVCVGMYYVCMYVCVYIRFN